MTLPTTYNIAGVKEYMQKVLGDTSRKLGWSVGGDDFDEPAHEVLYTLGEADFSFVDTAAEAARVRAVARLEAWRAAMYYTIQETSFSAGAPGTGTTSRADVHRHCKAMFELSKAEVLEKYPSLGALESREIEVYPIRYEGDYYSNAD